jgi:hypothetical protein
MDPSTATLLVGSLTAAVTIGGWITLHYFTLRREEVARREGHRRELEARRAAEARADYVRRLEILLKQTESKISDFYGPLHGLIHQIWATWEVKERMKGEIDPDTFQKVDHYLGERYFSPMHDEIRILLRSKMHLIEGDSMPPSFYEYIKHSVMENIQINMWNEKQIDTSMIKGINWPMKFPDDVAAGLHAAMTRYEGIIGELRRGEQSLPTAL